MNETTPNAIPSRPRIAIAHQFSARMEFNEPRSTAYRRAPYAWLIMAISSKSARSQPRCIYEKYVRLLRGALTAINSAQRWELIGGDFVSSTSLAGTSNARPHDPARRIARRKA